MANNSTDTVKTLNDTQLAEYLTSVNLKWIEAKRDASTLSIGSKAALQNAYRQKAIETVYSNAVAEAISRGILILH